MSKLRLVTFDVRNTLLKVRGSVGYQYAEQAKRFNVEVDPDRTHETFLSVFKTQRKIYPEFGGGQRLTSEIWWKDVVKKTFLRLGHHDHRLLENMSNNMYEHFKTNKAWEVIPNAEDVLAHIKDKNLRLGVISNFDLRLREVLRSCELEPYFDFVLSSEEARASKPQSKIYVKALQVLDDKFEEIISPKQALHIGDHVKKDYQAAKSAHWNAILIATPGIDNSAVPQEHVVQTMCEIIEKIDNFQEQA